MSLDSQIPVQISSDQLAGIHFQYQLSSSNRGVTDEGNFSATWTWTSVFLGLLMHFHTCISYGESEFGDRLVTIVMYLPTTASYLQSQVLCSPIDTRGEITGTM